MKITGNGVLMVVQTVTLALKKLQVDILGQMTDYDIWSNCVRLDYILYYLNICQSLFRGLDSKESDQWNIQYSLLEKETLVNDSQWICHGCIEFQDLKG